MGTRVYAVRIGDRYDQSIEDYINSKIDNVTWIREESIGKLQWNKLIPMSLDIDDPVCVIDIDIALINDYMDMINYPIERGEFVAAQRWWGEMSDDRYKLQGGFQKYYPKDCRYIYDKFVSNPEYWMEYYIKNGTTLGPVNGEQYFVQDSVEERLKLKYLPATWTTMWIDMGEYQKDFLIKYNRAYPGDYLYVDQFNPEIRLVHFLCHNKPHVDSLRAQGM